MAGIKSYYHAHDEFIKFIFWKAIQDSTIVWANPLSKKSLGKSRLHHDI